VRASGDHAQEIRPIRPSPARSDAASPRAPEAPVVGLGQAVARTATRAPELPALLVDGRSWTYGELLGAAGSLAALIGEVDAGGTGLCAVQAARSFWAYAGILGILLAGRGYVPLNPEYPPERSRRMLERSGARTVVVDAGARERLGDVLEGVAGPVTVISPDEGASPAWASGSPHRVLRRGDMPPPETDPREVRAEALAYLLFTSGTTGEPKGIGITNANVGAYLESAARRFEVEPGERCTQNFALTFDLSVHDMFVCWSAGACLCVPPARAVMAPAAFVREQAVTSWFSTPSTAAVMLRLRMLRPGAFPTLRRSLFCGEALTGEVAEAWAQAAPGSVVDNLYGPTEATIACTAYRYRRGTPPGDLVNGVVPIGAPYGRTRVAVVDSGMAPLPPGEVGELLLAGDQVAPGYWRDAERTARSFVSAPALPGPGPWYRTGDLAELNGEGDLLYRGRADDQIKIRGHRVELQEIEAVVRRASGAAIVVALGWPPTAAGADGVIVFTAGADASDEAILEGCRRRLPEYMLPGEIHRVESVPVNPSGKVDRRRLREMREALG
jgi:amino acid adenylation domain-containing protein